MRQTGTYQILGGIQYYIPHSLPPSNPPLHLTAEIMDLYGQASFALGQLNEMSAKLPNAQRFIKAYVIKEALLSSAIEGIHTTLIDVFTQVLHESKPAKDTQLVLNYTKALDVAVHMVRDEGFPIVSRVILRAHEALMSAGEGDKSHPGHYRKQSVRVGALVPPPAPEIPRLMHSLESYINEPSELPALIKVGLAHVQFETIHPFLDGNGRIGRLLIVLMFIDTGLLDTPILYPSYYFKKHHMEYYAKLDAVRTQGDFEGWIVYYLKGIRDSARDAYRRAQDIETLEHDLKVFIQTDERFEGIEFVAEAVLEYLYAYPVTTVSNIAKTIEKSYNTVNKIIKTFVDSGIIVHDGMRMRNKLYRFDPYLDLLERDYE